MCLDRFDYLIILDRRGQAVVEHRFIPASKRSARYVLVCFSFVFDKHVVKRSYEKHVFLCCVETRLQKTVFFLFVGYSFVGSRCCLTKKQEKFLLERRYVEKVSLINKT